MDEWKKRILSWKDDPAAFVREALQAEPQDWQLRVLNDIKEGRFKIAIRAGHGVGKTTLESWLVLWFLLFRRPCKIPVTANSQDQLRDVVWAEIAKWHGKLPDFLKAMIEVSTERITIKADPEGAFAVARTARPEKPEALQGFHSENLFFLIEEASGIDDIIFETAGGALTGENAMVVMCGNPTRTSGKFYRVFHSERERWSCHHVSCLDSPRVSTNYAADIAAEYGEDSNVYRVRVLGEFPTSEDDAVIPLGLVEAAIDREIVPSEAGVVWGLDVARFGDDASALAKRRGNTLLEPVKSWKKRDLMTLAGIVANEYAITPPENRPVAINTDVIGVGGGVVDRLKELGLPVVGINVGEASTVDAQRYLRLRDELWFRAREWFDKRACVIPKDDGLISELVQPKYKMESSGKIKVESKDDMKKRGVKSPDLADAFCLTFAGGELAIHPRMQQAVVDYDVMNYGQAERAYADVVGGSEWRPW